MYKIHYFYFARFPRLVSTLGVETVFSDALRQVRTQSVQRNVPMRSVGNE